MSFEAVPELLHDEHEDPPHFLDYCFLCKRSIGRSRDIFMSRGDTPFCSEECRRLQMEREEADERMHNLFLRMKAAAFKQQNKSVILFMAGTTVPG